MTLQISKLFIDYKDAKSILKSLDIEFVEEKEKSKTLHKSDFSQEFIRQSYRAEYREIYKVARENLDYNLLLKEDGAFFQFGYEQNTEGKISDLRYAYYEAPSLLISYEEFLEEMNLDYEECGFEFFEEYSQFVSEAELKNNVTSIRYDFSIEQRKELIHPVSHIHIGQQNDIRIPISFIMTPKSFVAFVVRHIYWNKWRIAMSNLDFRENYLQMYASSNNLKDELFTKDEKRDLYIHFQN